MWAGEYIVSERTRHNFTSNLSRQNDIILMRAWLTLQKTRYIVFYTRFGPLDWHSGQHDDDLHEHGHNVIFMRAGPSEEKNNPQL